MLADSVGLGKTHVAREIVRRHVARGGTVLVTAPAALRSHWTRHLRGIAGWRWTSHTSLSRRAATDAATLVVVDEAHAFRNPATRRWTPRTRLPRRPPPGAPTRVVVDEAPGFRNPATRRYASLAIACEHARVLLLTATPVNNSLSDFHHLIRLFAPNDAFA